MGNPGPACAQGSSRGAVREGAQGGLGEAGKEAKEVKEPALTPC